MYSVFKSNTFDHFSDALMRTESVILSSAEVLELERYLLENAGDVDVRVKLLCYYGRTPEGRIVWRFSETRRKHVRWVIENMPEHALACSVTNGLEALEAGDFVDELACLWNRKVEEFPTDFDVLFNASLFFEDIALYCDALALLLRARKLKGRDYIIDARVKMLRGFLK